MSNREDALSLVCLIESAQYGLQFGDGSMRKGRAFTTEEMRIIEKALYAYAVPVAEPSKQAHMNELARASAAGQAEGIKLGIAMQKDRQGILSAVDADEAFKAVARHAGDICEWEEGLMRNAWDAALKFAAQQAEPTVKQSLTVEQAEPGAEERAPLTWYDGEPPFPQREEWFIAETIFGDRVVLRALSEHHSYDYTTADHTYMKAKNIERWMQFPDCEYLPPKAAQSGQRAGVAETAAARDVLAERARQISAEGWTPEHDDEHADGQMALAAGYYALACAFPHERDIGGGRVPSYWPWDKSWWKPRDPRRNLVKAGALILAEIERLDRAAASHGVQHG
ncbi:hypothetical protein ACI2VH_02665 [Ralstonia nicotianae]